MRPVGMLELYAEEDFPVRSEHGQAQGVVMDLTRHDFLASVVVASVFYVVINIDSILHFQNCW